MDFAKLLFSLRGRIGRRDFWLGWVILIIVQAVASAIGSAGASSDATTTGLVGIVALVILLPMLWAEICLLTKRLHDLGRSGWAIAVFVGFELLTLLLGFIADMIFQSSAPIYTAVMALILIACGAQIWVGAKKGQPGPNRFGDPPRKHDPFPAPEDPAESA